MLLELKGNPRRMSSEYHEKMPGSARLVQYGTPQHLPIYLSVWGSVTLILHSSSSNHVKHLESCTLILGHKHTKKSKCCLLRHMDKYSCSTHSTGSESQTFRFIVRRIQCSNATYQIWTWQMILFLQNSFFNSLLGAN